MSKVSPNTSTVQGQDGATGSNSESQPVLASTMILVRDQPSGYEVFMIERPKTGAFPKLHVFPGGKIDPLDSEMDQYCPYLSEVGASEILKVEDQGLRFWVGAIRECFEECGVLFALQNGQLFEVRTERDRQELRGWAAKVATSREFFQLLLEERRLNLATDHVHYFSHWITPEFAPTRFNTRFFLAKLPSGQLADALTSEVVSACWIQPRAAFEKFKTKEWQMILPTLTTLRMISHYTDADDLVRHVRAGYHKIPVRPGKQLQGLQPFQDQW